MAGRGAPGGSIGRPADAISWVPTGGGAG